MIPDMIATVAAVSIIVQVGWVALGSVRFMTSIGVRMIAPSRFVNAVLAHGDVCVPYQPLRVEPASHRIVDTMMRVVPVRVVVPGGFVVAMSMVAVKPKVIGMSIFKVNGWW